MESSITLLLHIVTGSLAIGAGILALCVRKGGRIHNLAGKTFFYTMIAMALSGAVIAWFKPMMISVIAGIYTAYLVASAWKTVASKPKSVNGLDYLLTIIAFGVFACGLIFGFEATSAESGLKDGFSAGPYFFFAGLGLVAGLLDVNMLVRGGLHGPHRIARHLWRMIFALYIAVGSLLTQGGKALPQSVQESPILAMFEDLFLLIMLFWLMRVLVWPKLKTLIAKLSLRKLKA